MSRVAISMFALSVIAASAGAQCDPVWISGHPAAALNGRVRAITQWDPDGSGPRPRLPVVGGLFTAAGAVTLNNVASWTESGWEPLGGGTTGGQGGQVSALATLQSGELVAAGFFFNAGSTPVESIATWDGQEWSALGGGLTGMGTVTVGGVRALLVLDNGDLIAGGEFMLAGGSAARSVARWDGTSWHPMGDGLTRVSGTYDPAVFALALHPDGSIYAAGQFDRSGTTTLSHIARWDGTSWTSVGVGANAYITALTIMPDGDVVAGGGFTALGSVNAAAIARWDGDAWSPYGLGLDNAVRGLCIDSAGALVATGFFGRTGGSTRNHIARWGGSTWLNVGTGLNAEGLAIATLDSGEIAVGGMFTTAGGISSPYFARRAEPPVPWLTRHPENVSVACGEVETLTVLVAPGISGVAYQWRRNGINVDVNDNPTAATALLAISGSDPFAAGAYDCVVSNVCDAVTSSPGSVEATPCCPGDFNRDGFVTGDDYDLYVVAFELGDLGADFNDDGFVTGDDFDVYGAAFEQGC